MPRPETITSAANPLVKDVRRAISRGGLTEQGWCVAETFHLLEEALRSDCEVMTVLASQSGRMEAEARVGLAGIPVVVLADALFKKIAGTETSQGVIALVKPPVWRMEQLFGERPMVVVLDQLQDPGNVGTIIRAAEAFGASGVLFVRGTVSPYNPKALRAAAGSLFRVPFVYGLDPGPARSVLQENRVDLYAAVPARADAPVRSLTDVDFTSGCGLVIGNEARGVCGELRSAAMDISIPTVGVESLNAAVAAGILLYEARRQRALRL